MFKLYREDLIEENPKVLGIYFSQVAAHEAAEGMVDITKFKLTNMNGKKAMFAYRVTKGCPYIKWRMKNI